MGRVVARIAATLAAALAAAWLTGCAGSLPSIPDTPAAVMAKADALFDRESYFQASELYRAFLERYPGDDRSDAAQFRLAESYFRDGEYELASVEYQILLANYGYSSHAPEALYRIGVCFWEQAPKAVRDQQKSYDALAKFEQFIQTFPEHPLVPEAQDYVRRVHRRLAEKAMIALRWYYKRGRFQATLIYCDKIIDSYPDNEFYVEALYLKGTILFAFGEVDEAVQLFSRVMAWPEDLRVKAYAEEKLKEARER
ncbi:MAG: outer membrane protein assembly factor BamD [Candidatus Krumholzibacteria bacterium]|nr:outer membrane protein assembly factor BamD [Candidatus Krumholzibacteria bacterium]